VDTAVTTALIAAGGVVLSGALGGGVGYLTSRKQRTATVELTEAQTDELAVRAAAGVVQMQQGLIKQYGERISWLEEEISRLRQLVADRERREQELVGQLETLRGERDALHTELTSLRAQLAAKEVELRATRQEAAELRVLAIAPTPSGSPPAVAA